MLVAAVPAVALGTNCWVVAPAAGEECLVVDPGIGVVDRLDATLAEHRLRPVAVLLTHGHVDHTFSVAPVCGARGVPAYLHPGDDALLADPWLGLEGAEQLLAGTGLRWSEPDDVRPLPDAGTLRLAGLDVTVSSAPGHTPGSVVFALPGAPDDLVGAEASATLLSGDVLFAGSIGRCDLPGGDPAAMTRTLREVILPMPDDVLVLPGHLQITTIGRERATNPYLRQAAVSAAAPGRRVG